MLRINDGGSFTTNVTTTSGGAYTFTGLTYSAGSILTVFVDGAAEDAVTVTVGPGTDLSGLDLYQDYLIVRQDNGGSLTNANLDDAEPGDSDVSSIYSVTSGTLSLSAGKTLYVWTGDTYAPGGTVDVTGNIKIVGTLSAAANAVSVGGNFTNATGTFTHTGLLTFNGTTAQTFNPGLAQIGSDIRNSNTSNTVTLSGNSLNSGSNDLTIDANAVFSLNGNSLEFVTGTFVNNGTLRLQGGETIGFSQDTDSGVWEYVGDGDSASDSYTIKDFGTTDYYTLRIASTDSGDSFSNSAAKAVAGLLTVTNGTLNANAQTTTVTGLATVSGGTYTASTDTQTFNGGLTVSGGTFTGSSGTVDVNGVFTLSSGTFTAPSGTMTVSGNFARTGGTFTHNSGTVTFDGSSQTISGSSSFQNFSKTSGGGQTLTLTSGTTQTVAGTLTLQGTSAGSLLALNASSGGSAAIINSTSATYGMTNTNAFLSVTDISLRESGTAKSPEFFASGLGNSTDGGGTTGWFASSSSVASSVASSAASSAASCGNNVIEGSEVCDGTSFAASQDTCQEWSSAYTGGSVRCASNCLSVSTQYCSPQCGNAIPETGEECDDGNFVNNDGCSASCTKDPTKGGSGGGGYVVNVLSRPKPPPTPQGTPGSCCRQKLGYWQYPVYYSQNGIVDAYGGQACDSASDVLVFTEDPTVDESLWSMCQVVDGYCCRMEKGCYHPVDISQGDVCRGGVIMLNSSPTVQMTNVKGERVTCPAWPTCQVQCGSTKEVIDPQCAQLVPGPGN